jgi:putative protein-disulfide isomerase
MTPSRLYYVHDPMCSWCWGFRPVLDELVRALPAGLPFSRLLGGLAPDCDQPMPSVLRAHLVSTWRRIQEQIPGTRFNFDFWQSTTPRRSTWPACRAVIAARRLRGELEAPMIGAIQHAYYLEARNPSDNDTLIELAVHLGLDAREFAALLNAGTTQARLDDEMALARSMGADSFPSLRLVNRDAVWPIAVDYHRVGPMLDAVRSLLDL